MVKNRDICYFTSNFDGLPEDAEVMVHWAKQFSDQNPTTLGEKQKLTKTKTKTKKMQKQIQRQRHQKSTARGENKKLYLKFISIILDQLEVEDIF